MTPTQSFPLVNDWRRGCWVARPTGKADRAYVYDREFCRGTPHKASGMVRYTLADLGGPGWVVAKTAYGVRRVVEVTDLGWVDHGELPAFSILEVVQAGDWDGARCDGGSPDCRQPAVFEPEGVCDTCERESGDRVRVAAERAGKAAEVPF